MTNDGTVLLAEVASEFRAIVDSPTETSEDELTRLRLRARAAVDRLDDAPDMPTAHDLMDSIGAFVRHNRPQLCFLEADGSDFRQVCPVALAHTRIGISVASEIVTSRCSICDSDPWDCAHIPGEIYDAMVAERIITEARFFEVSFVRRPDFPDARIVASPISRAAVEESLGHQLPAGATPVCDRCLNPCPGFVEVPETIV